MITVKLMGGLGNQMFQYALAKNLAIKNDTGVIFDLTFLRHRMQRGYVFRNYDLDIFDIKEKTTLLSKAPDILKNPTYIIQTIINKIGTIICPKYYRYEKKQYEFESEILNSEKNCYLSGYWQNEKYFKDISPEIKKIFTSFKNELSPKAKELLKKIKNNNSVCINFRRTDYVQNNETKKFHGNVEDDFYTKGIKLISQKNTNIHLYVFSDDIEWCKNNFKTNFPITFVDYSYKGEKFSDYLQLMIGCKNFVIPNSTFAWWAAWLSDSKDKIVVAPQKWVAAENIKADDIIPSEWIKI